MSKRLLMQKRAAVIDEAKTLVASATDGLSVEQRAKIDELTARATAMGEDIKRLESVEILDGELSESDGRTVRGAPAVNVMPRGDDKDGTRGFLHYLRTGQVNSDLQMRASNATDINIGTNADGGYLVPTGLLNRIIAKRNESMLANKLGIVDVPGVGTTVNVPYDNGAAELFVSTAEANAYDLDAPIFGQHSMTLVNYSKQLKLSNQILRDEDAKLLPFLGDYVGRAYAKTHNSLLLTALIAGGTAYTLGAAGGATATDIPGIVYSLPDGYEDRATFLMRRATEGSYKALTGSVFQFTPTPAGGERSFWGYPILNTAYAEAIGTGNQSIIFGNFEYVLKREDPAMTVLRDPYSSASTGQINMWYYFATVYKVAIAEAIRVGTHP